MVLCVAVAAPVVLAPLAGRAGQSPFDLDPAVDAPLLVAGAALSAVPPLFYDDLPLPSCYPSCDPNDVNAWDRTVIGYDFHAAKTASDALAAGSVGLPLVLDLIDALAAPNSDGFFGFAKDFVVLGETVSLSLALSTAVKYAVRRPRPYMYADGAVLSDRQEEEASLSFYSAHTSTAFAMATAYSYLFSLRHPDSPLVVPCWITTHLLAAAVGGLRIAAGWHFYTDVLTGAVLGSAVGLLVPYLRKKRTDAGRAEALSFRLVATPLDRGVTVGVVLW